MFHRWSAVLTVIWVLVAAAPLVYGWQFYELPTEERPDSPLYDLYKPSGVVGHGLGIVGTTMLAVGVSFYIARKRVEWMQGLGKLRDWLRVHIFLCTLGPYLVLLHTTLKIGNVAAVAFWAMTIVVISGVFGRYVYHHIPKTADGEFFTEGELISKTAESIEEAGEMTGVSSVRLGGIVTALRPNRTSGLLAGIQQALLFDIRSRALKRALTLELVAAGVAGAAVTEAVPILMDGLKYEQRLSILVPMQRLFGYWHVFHVPLALVMLLTLIVHIGVAVAFGYHWIF